MCDHEASRIFSATGFTLQRTFIESKNGEAQVEKGLLINMNWLRIFYKEKILEKPFEFTPERLEREDYNQKRPLADLIFSVGPRAAPERP